MSEGGAYCPLLVVPKSLLQGFSLHVQLLDTGLGFSHGVCVGVGRVAPGQAVSAHGATCLTEVVTGQVAPQQSPVHVDVGGNQLVDAEPQDGAIDQRGLGVEHHFVFQGWGRFKVIDRGNGQEEEREAAQH